MDFSLSFLDEFVADALEAGARPYKPAVMRQEPAGENIGKPPSGLVGHNQGFSCWTYGACI